MFDEETPHIHSEILYLIANIFNNLYTEINDF